MGTQVIVTGHVTVSPDERAGYLADCVEVVRRARATDGCLDFAISADPLDADRINILERWTSQDAVDSFRGDGPGDEQAAAMTSASVAEYDVASVRSLT